MYAIVVVWLWKEGRSESYKKKKQQAQVKANLLCRAANENNRFFWLNLNSETPHPPLNSLSLLLWLCALFDVISM